MGRPKKAATKPAEIPPEEESQEIFEEEPEDEDEEDDEAATGGRPTISKADAVREALAQGIEAPGDIVDFMKKKYDIDMPKQMASSYKAQIRTRDAKKAGEEPAKPGRKPREAPQAEASPAPRQAPSPTGDIIGDIEATRRLLDRHGKDGLKRLIDALG